MKLGKIKTLVILTFAASVFAANISAQNAELVLGEGIKAHIGIDEIYKKFSESYRILKPEIVTNLYTENAAYLPPNSGILTGRTAILQNFTEFFNSVKNDGRNMTISFQILQRKVEKKIGYDVGIYTIKSYKDGEKIGESKGKFVVVAVREKDGKWRFQVDGYSSLTPPPKN